MFLRTSPRSTNWKTKCFASRWFLGKIEEIWEQYPFLIRGQDYAILLMPDLILNLEWTLGISVGSSPISLFWVLALVRYISKFGDLGIWGDFKNVGSSPIYSSVGSRTDPHFFFPASEALKIFWGPQKRPNFWILDLRDFFWPLIF